MTNDTNKSAGKSALMKVLFVVGIIVAIIALGFALLYIVPRIVNGVSNAASAINSLIRGKDDSIELAASDVSVDNNESFTLSWIDTDATAATTYSLSYSCEDNLIVSIDGDEVDCEDVTDVSFIGDEVEVEAELSEENSFADIVFTLSAFENNDIAREGTVIVTVHTDGADTDDETDTDSNDSDSNDSSTDSDDTDEPVIIRTSSNTTSSSASYVQGPADLHIASVETGVVRSGQFYSASNIDEDETAALRFTVANLGGRPTGSWSFNYSHPISGKPVQNSGSQPSMAPGQIFQYVVTFSSHSDGRVSTAIALDPANYIAEANEGNNQATATFDFDGSSDDSDSDYNSNDDADLVVDILETGYLSGSRFVEDSRPDANDTVALKFKVTNKGGESTGSWKFEVKMTGDDSQTYRSSSQQSLQPGQTIEFVIGFDGIDEDAEDIELEVEVDSTDSVDEERENNNTDSTDVRLDN